MKNNYNPWINKNINKSNFENKNVFISGGNSGIGFELAKQCAYLGANIFLLCRNINRAENAKNELLNIYPNTKIEIIELDLASLSSIKKAVEEISNYKIDIFVNNAGVFRLPKSTTKDGFELVMGTNFIGTLYLSNLLIPILEKQSFKSKMLYETSITSKISKVDLNDLFMDKHYNEMKIYGRSKAAINSIYFINANLYNNIVFSLAHPGSTYTPLISKGFTNKVFHFFASLFMKIFFHSPAKASLSLLKALDSDKNICIGPRGFLGISGYPHKWNIKKPKNYEKCIALANTLINQKVN